MTGTGIGDKAIGKQALERITLRLIPFMFTLYIAAYVDRINIGFAALQMKQQLHMSDAAYGFGAGIFFIGYFFFEIPSNLVMERVGARIWMTRIMITWGVISSAMMFTRSAMTFYVLRTLLGVAEAGFFPGMILYLTYWFPARERARATALFMTASPISGVIAGWISPWLLKMDGIAGLAGWQWLFLIEGLPPILLGFVTLSYLTDRPEQSAWLPDAERDWLSKRLALEGQHRSAHSTDLLGAALGSGQVWLLSLLYLSLVTGVYGVNFWMPLLVKQFSGLSNVQVSFLTTLPYIVAAVGMVWVARHSDRSGERRLHVAIPALVGAIGFVLNTLVHSTLLSIVTLSIGALGIWGACGTFWTLPTAFLTGTAAAGAIALINSVGNLGGFLGPYIVGWLKQATGGFAGPLLFLAGSLGLGCVLALSVKHDHTLELPFEETAEQAL